jgi:hypothetical protein
VTEFIAALGAKNRVVEVLPPEAPTRNRVEWQWEHRQDREPDNRTCLDREDRHAQFSLALNRVRGNPRLFHSFFVGADLPL